MTALSEGDAALTRLAAVLDDTSIDYTFTNFGGWRVVLTVREEFSGETADTAVDAALASVAAREYSKQREEKLREALERIAGMGGALAYAGDVARAALAENGDSDER